MANAEPIERYGARWPAGTDDLQIEMACIRKGGKWGDGCGAGLTHHYEQMRRLLWPHLDGEHNGQRWHVLIRNEVIGHKIVTMMGPGSSGKTHSASWIYLCEYLCFPDETCVLVSSTDIRGLRMRVWGELTMLWDLARKRYDYIPGHLLDSRLAITTESLEDGDFEGRTLRDMRKGIVGIPTMSNGKFIGLGKWVGIKQKRVRLIADEAQMMGSTFLSAFANLNKNVDFRACILGNPNDILDPLGKAAEPKEGWEGHMEPESTSVWDTRFMDGRCVNLIGTDSPNFDFPANEPTRFPYLISKEKIEATLSFFSKDSVEYYSQCIGAMKVGQLARRVLTRSMCENFGALEVNVVWVNMERTKIYALDAAYGGDRCVGGSGEFGKVLGGHVELVAHPPRIIPIKVGGGEPEDQISKEVKKDCESLGIPPENMFHDATGRGSLGTSLARVWSAMTNPVEFGGKPTKRPVSMDLWVFDQILKARRLITCEEHYGKFVTELWFSVRYAVEARQVHGMTAETMEEFCMREWISLPNNKRDVETKDDMKERVGRSPDFADWFSILVEGARRKGFMIAKLANEEERKKTEDWLGNLHKKQTSHRVKFELSYK